MTVRPRFDLIALAFCMVFPSLAAWLYFVEYSGQPAMGAIYSATKVLQFGFPAVWVFLICRELPAIGLPRWKGSVLGALFGVLAGIAIVALYLGVLRGGALRDTPAVLLEKLRGFGATTPGRYVALGVFISVIHSFLEEYYWRWFVCGRLARHTSPWTGVVVSSLAFTAHHVIVLTCYLGPANWPGIVLLSLGVAAGGAFWAWLYGRTRSLTPVWISHLLVDAALMLLGFDLVWPFM